MSIGKKTFDILLISSIILLILLLLVLIYGFKKEGTKCILDPFGYSVEILVNKMQSNVECYCFATEKPSILFGFNSTNIILTNPYK